MLTEKRSLILDDGRTIEYFVDRGKRRNTYISVRDGRVVLKLSVYSDIAKGEQFIREKADWILQSLKTHHSEALRPVSFTEGERFTLAGEEYVITCEPAERYQPPRFEDGRLTVYVSRNSDERYVASQAARAVADKTMEIIRREFERLTALTGLFPRKVTVKQMSASWGRCSSNGDISINSNAVFYDLECIDYVIIHELCHLRHMDHSPEFWALVGKYCPDWKRIRGKMK